MAIKNEVSRKEKGIWIPGAIISDFREYKRIVYNITRNQKLHTLDNHKTLGYQLDHKFSIWYGFHMNILPEYIGDINNLEYLTEADNKSKSVNCSIFLGDLKITERYK